MAKAGTAKPSVAERVFVALRVRPLNERERELKSEIVVSVSGATVSIRDGGAGSGAEARAPDDDGARSFTFDRCYWSVDERDGRPPASQVDLFNDLGTLLIDNAWRGFNASVFAYGQTGSGKTFAMMGSRADPGVIPLACSELFRRVELARALEPAYTASIEVSYLEIYNEVVRDLLDPSNNAAKGGLKVREHASFGVYVQGLARLVASSYEEIDKLLTLGARERTVAATRMNAASSRSHAVLTLYFTQSTKEDGVSDPVRKMSKMNLVDLAGSEHQVDTGATGARLKEACAINKSLSALSNVISALSTGARHVPYRDSVLTRLLQESLGGNAKSVMLAAISPAAVNFTQSLSTLRYANRAKSIVNKPIVNEGGDGAIIKGLKEEIDRLRAMLRTGAGGVGAGEAGESGTSAGAGGSAAARGHATADVHELVDELAAQSALVDNLKLSPDERAALTTSVLAKREASLREQGVTLKDIGVALGHQQSPYLINLNPDPSLSETMLYYIREGATVVGFGSAHTPVDIALAGLRVADRHCTFDNMASHVVLTPEPDAPTYVNGAFVVAPRRLTHGDRIVFGKAFVFRFADPVAAEHEPASGFGWEDAVREMSSVLGLKLASGEHDGMHEALIRAAFLADEANDMARSLGKKAVFAVDIEPQLDGPPRVAIRSTSLLSGLATVVPVAAFEDRVQLMYEVMVTAETGASALGGLRAGEDPFFDPPPDVLVAEGLLDLAPLARLEGIDKTIALSPDGELEVSIRPLDARTFAFLEPVSDIRALFGTKITFVLALPAARNLAGAHLNGLFVRYNFPEDDKVEVTERVPVETAHPEFNYRDRFEMTIDADFVRYVKSTRLCLQVFGRAALIPNDDAEASASELRARVEYLAAENTELVRLNETFIRRLETTRKQLDSAQVMARERQARWDAAMEDSERQSARIAALEAEVAAARATARKPPQPHAAAREPALLPAAPVRIPALPVAPPADRSTGEPAVTGARKSLDEPPRTAVRGHARADTAERVERAQPDARPERERSVERPELERSPDARARSRACAVQ